MVQRVIDLTVNELLDAITDRLDEREDKETVNTEKLAEILQCSPAQIGVYGRAGMYEEPGCRIKKDCWNPKACKTFISTKYQEMLKSGRKRKMLKTKKK
jgi:hypothetical protein